MTRKPNFSVMTTAELRAYVLEHRQDEDALHAYLDKLHADNPNPRTYSPDVNVSDAIAAYLNQHQ